MTEIKLLMEHIDGEITDAACYARLALEYKDRDKDLAELFYRLSGEELDHMTRLHSQVVRLIDNQRRAGAEVSETMMAVYDFLHKRDIDKAAEVGVLQAMYKGK